MDTSNKLNWAVLVLGLWEIAAPFVLGYAGITAAVWNAVIIGVVIAGLALWSALTDSPATAQALDWGNVILGLWLIAAPFIFGDTGVSAFLWNAIIVGLLVAGLETWAALSIRSESTVA